MRAQVVGVGHAPHHAVVAVAPHQEEVGGRQHGDCHARVGQPPGELRNLVGRQQRKLGHMPDDDTPSALVLLGQVPHLVDEHAVGRGAHVEVDVDVGVVLAREFEYTVDLRGAVGVVARRAAEHAGAALEALDQQFVRARVVGEAFLREHAHLDIDRPLVVAGERLDGLEAAHADARVDFDLCAHARGAVQDAFLQRAFGALVGVLVGHGVLDRRHALDRGVGCARLRGAPIDDPGLVDVDVGLHEARAGQAPARVVDRALCGEVRADGCDAAVLDADVDGGLAGRAIGQSGVANDEIHGGIP